MMMKNTAPLKIFLAAVVFMAAIATVYTIHHSFAQFDPEADEPGGSCSATGNGPGQIASGKTCALSHCRASKQIIENFHCVGEENITQHVTDEFDEHQKWAVETFFKKNILPAMMMMTEQLSAVGFQQIASVGMMIDAKEQLEVQRDHQYLQYQAHKDYQPSQDFCAIGTGVRSLGGSYENANYASKALNTWARNRSTGQMNSSGAGALVEDRMSRWDLFTQAYCDPNDNNFRKSETGLTLACGTVGDAREDAENNQRVNADIDYARVISEPRTINADFTQTDLQARAAKAKPGGAKNYPDGQNVISLSTNLYGHQPLTRQLSYLTTTMSQEKLIDMRSIAAKRSVAQHSFNEIAGLKVAGTPETGKLNPSKSTTAKYLGEVLKNLGVPDSEVTVMIGEQPSYYAQLEILAKRLYQSPDFYSNLYDKPANVARKGAALQAIELMVDRESYESQLRREMILSVLLSSRLNSEFDPVNRKLKGGQ
jgi:hypothetical protein